MRRLGFLVLTCLFLASVARAQERPKLNLVSVVTDDQGRWALGAYGNRECRTPNMDRLARDGARFTNAFTVTPVCSPSRASFMTGRYGTQLGITDWISPDEANAGMGLPVGVVTWPEPLAEHGYATALVGKWHLGTQPKYHPTARGFNHFFGFLGGGNTPMDPTLEVEGKEKKLTGPLPDLLTDDAIRFVEGNRERPFALCLHFRAPHLPYGPVPEEDSKPFKTSTRRFPKPPLLDTAQVKKWTRDYYASIHSVDRNLGRLLGKLDELKLSERTVVMFTSDHGYMIGHHTMHMKGNGLWVAGGVNGPKRPNMFDDSVHPLLVKWPGVVKPGTEIHETVTNLDTFPSVLGMLGIATPEGVKHHGLDFSLLLRGKKVAWRDVLFGQYDLHNGGLAYMRMVRTSGWKLVRHHHANGLNELYDLGSDPDEKTNLYARPGASQGRDELQAKLTEWQRSIDDPLGENHERRPRHELERAERPALRALLSAEHRSFPLPLRLPRHGRSMGPANDADALGGPYPKLETHLLRNFRKYAYRDAARDDALWNWLALAAHHGLPTRLLDWTYSPSVALHFVTENLEHYEPRRRYLVRQLRHHQPQPARLAARRSRRGRLQGLHRRDAQPSDQDARGIAVSGPEPVPGFLRAAVDRRSHRQPVRPVLGDVHGDGRLDDWLQRHPDLWFRIIVPRSSSGRCAIGSTRQT
jgi:uncharacterized sulfatase